MPIVPDDKNWTWVLEKPCPDCGFDSATVVLEDVPEMVRSIAAQWPELLAHPMAAVRPTDDQWSAVEYGCHVRDVIALYDYRANLMMTEDDPTFPNWDQDVTAIEQRYDLADPAETAREIVAVGELGAERFAEVARQNGWARPGTRSDGAQFTLDTFVRYMRHDPIHHIWDVHQGHKLLDSR
jgi:hypothetical protein